MYLMEKAPRISASQLARRLGISRRAVEKQISKLKSTGMIERRGPPKGGYWVVIP